MRKLIYIIIALVYVGNFDANGQTIGNYKGDESKLYAETKQFTQFIKRFNNEEDVNGQPYPTGSYKFREPTQRKKYLEILFDGQNQSITRKMKNDFIDDVTNKKSPKFIEKHQGGYFAEVESRFLYKGKNTNITLYLKLQPDSLGYKWALFDCYSNQIQGLFANNSDKKNFLHPMSHEIDFMNLHRAFRDTDELEDYATNEHEVDYLSILFFLIKSGDLTFVTVSNVKFHVLQIEGWYFSVEQFERDSYNSGWMISNLMPLKPEDKEVWYNYILHKQ
ncbi:MULTISPECIES: hypothetical protein [Flammeovirga]|uniref:Uncharacterized protein n=1 Tax=Flammeovirga agarivorans TaxID=2726742 RepID=A0A7X8XWD8_9BACT|nr:MULTISPECIES: hypothetical protein [Flammeovirga]NLR92222.1 hypothetical protein [Flammeovirga agarivorans]